MLLLLWVRSRHGSWELEGLDELERGRNSTWFVGTNLEKEERNNEKERSQNNGINTILQHCNELKNYIGNFS